MHNYVARRFTMIILAAAVAIAAIERFAAKDQMHVRTLQ
jgi:hypothetical protein